MASQNGSNAYKIRYEGNTAEKRIESKPSKREQQRHIRPNMTVKLNKKKESKPSLAPRPLVRRFRSMDAAQIRLVFAGVFAFSIVIAFFVFSVVCEVKNNELDHYIKESMNILSGLENDYDGLVVKKETLMSDSAIQTYAEDNLGMQKRDNHQLYWFEVDWENDFDD